MIFSVRRAIYTFTAFLSSKNDKNGVDAAGRKNHVSVGNRHTQASDSNGLLQRSLIIYSNFSGIASGRIKEELRISVTLFKVYNGAETRICTVDIRISSNFTPE